MRTFASESRPSLACQKERQRTTVALPAHPVLNGQRTLGNQGMLRLLRGALARRIQPKLTVGPVGDIYEQEAERISATVMRMPETASRAALTSKPGDSALQRCSCGTSGGTQCEECQAKSVQRISTAPSASSGMSAPASVHNVLASSGHQLNANTRSFMEQRFGHDFRHVRLHTDGQAAESAREVNARAYTVGSDVVFGAGQYDPVTTDGRQLIAHELTHVLQQRDGGDASLRRAIHFVDPPVDTWRREDPLPKALRNERILGLTTPTINGTVLPADPADPKQRPQVAQQRGQLVLDAMIPKHFRRVGSDECAFEDYNVAVSARVMVGTRPAADHRWGPSYQHVSDIPNAGVQERCKDKDLVPVAMLGEPSAESVADTIEANEREHVTDLRQIFNETLVPLFNRTMAIRGRGADPDQCSRAVQANWDRATHDRATIEETVVQFLHRWVDSIHARDGSNSHNIDAVTSAKGRCDRVEIIVKKHH
jgi:hypothetical protein